MLRSITDSENECWEVVRGHESYGAMVVLFCRRSDNRVMKAYLMADNALDADRELDDASDQLLLDWLAEAAPGP